MVLNANEEALLGLPSEEDLDFDHQNLEYAPREDKKIGKWTVIALILNRTIGSGIFLTPHRILAGTGCVGGALLVWTAGALISICGLYVWLECGLSIPQRRISDEAEPRGVPRSGGEKNFLEFMFPNSHLRLPHIRTTCSFAMMFLLMYNLSGNAIGFALKVMTASGLHDPASGDIPSRGTAIGIAISTLSAVVLLHMLSRRGGIIVNNGFAIFKVSLLLAIVCLGIAKAAGSFGGPGAAIRNNFTSGAFETQQTDPVSWSSSLVLSMYTFSGYEQPFYVLAETRSPRRHFPKYTVLAMVFTAVLFLLVNIAYLLAVDKDVVLGPDATGIDLASLFFDSLFVDDHQSAEKAMAALIAVSIFGNLWVMTFTASRVKQEIAKEGILPWSLIIAKSYSTPWTWLRRSSSRPFGTEDAGEKAPTAAFALHWCTSVLLIIVVSPVQDPRKSYSFLVSLYSYTIVALLGCWVSIGLLKLKLHKTKWHWQERRRYRPWLSPIHVVIYGLATAFMLVTAFVPPRAGSPFHSSISGIPWYLVPAIGITAPFWGVWWYWGLLIYEWKIDRQLTVSRQAYWVQDPDYPSEFLQRAELVEHGWSITFRETAFAGDDPGVQLQDRVPASSSWRRMDQSM